MISPNYKHKSINSPVYLYEIDELLGGDALYPQDLASLALSDIKWTSTYIDINDKIAA